MKARKETRNFLGFMIQSGLMEYEGSAYISHLAFCEGYDRDSLIHDYCKKAEIEFERLDVNDDGKYYDWGFPIYFIPIITGYSADKPIPQFIDIKDMTGNPFLEDETRMFVGWVWENKDIMEDCKDLMCRKYFGIYKGHNMTSLIKDFTEKTGVSSVTKVEDSDVEHYTIPFNDPIVFAPVHETIYDKEGNYIPVIGEPTLNPFVNN